MYRYSFQGQERDDEIKGEGNSINYKYRMHDPRLGRFFAVDPLAAKYPHNSVYAFSENNVVHAVELEGLEKVEVNHEGVVTSIDEEAPASLYYRGQKDDKLHEIQLNDYKLDVTQLSSAKVGDQLVHFLDYTDVNYIFDYQGVDEHHYGYPGVNWIKSLFQNEGGSLDFGFSYLRIRMLENAQLDGKDLGVTFDDSYSLWDGKGGFFIFTGLKIGENYQLRAFNLPDAGNFLFGCSMARLNANWIEVKLGTYVADSNDPVADKTAVELGYMYHKNIINYHYASNLFPQFSSWELTKPSIHNSGKYFWEVLLKNIKPFQNDPTFNSERSDPLFGE